MAQRLNGLDPIVYLREVIGCIADHPINRINELLPWNLAQRHQARAEEQTAQEQRAA